MEAQILPLQQMKQISENIASIICKQVASEHYHQVQIDLPPPVTGCAMSEHTYPCGGSCPWDIDSREGQRRPAFSADSLIL